MDAGHDRSKWRRSCVAHTLILLFVLSLTAVEALYENPSGHNSSQSEKCADNEYESGTGFCCDRCPPGYKLKKHCPGKGLRSECDKCAEGTYLDAINSLEKCFACRICKKDEDVVSACTIEKNTVCACKTGYYKKVINRITWSCKPCKKCVKENKERIRRECGGEKNTECECIDSYYRGENKCLPCTNCTEKCPDWCSTTPRPPIGTFRPTPDSSPATGSLTVILAVVLAVMLLSVGYKHWRKHRRASHSIESPESHKYETKQPTVTTTVKDENSGLTSHWTEKEIEKEKDQLLPDCVPREIRTHEFIYSVLEVVPVSRFKELARRLSVSEQDIDRAERDNRAFADAQYQMLKIWSTNAPGGGKNIVPRDLLQEFVDTLKDMNLNGCAESIENKYCNEA
ncbi:tumor necrosis factor receptor superfamily member 1A [Astyanax mexicanus]|uniref:tumor necrosis factor receptor superfamily member 1A n=1 Tax=Astyanax mexicanus TaxID=7994 RepID=UPI0020CB68C5|nr:tumor necrosis factor receptor superfamily member 1A [Astyanax mexicanus]